MSLFEVYQRIISGDLRPNLKIYNSKKGLKELKGTFFSKRIKVVSPENAADELEDFLKTNPRYKSGDTVNVKINNTTKKITVEFSTPPGEEDLINIDIPPPSDFRGELFSSIIGDEYLRIKNAINDKLKKSSNSEELEFFANHSISMLKQIAIEAHFFEKRLNTSETKESKSAKYVLMVLKKHILYSIIEIEISLKAFIKNPLQTEYELEDELYDFSASEREERARKNLQKLDKRYIQKLYGEIVPDANEETILDFFRQKTLYQEQYIETGVQVYSYHFRYRDLILNEYGKLLANQLSNKIFELASDYREKLSFLLQERIKLFDDKNSIEHRALLSTDFFYRLDLRINSLKDLLTHGIPSSDQLLKDLISFGMHLQSRKGRNYKENDLNADLCGLLRAKGYDVSDQTHHGRSGTGHDSSIPGELDIAIRDTKNNGIIKSIVECFVIDSCGPENKVIANHIDKLINRYDTAGNQQNFVIVFAMAKDFHGLWERYRNYVTDNFFKSRSGVAEFTLSDLTYENIKVGVTSLQQNSIERQLFHIFIDMYNE